MAGAAVGGTPPDLAAMVPLNVAQPSEVTFLPYLSGERTPHNDPWCAAPLSGWRRVPTRRRWCRR